MTTNAAKLRRRRRELKKELVAYFGGSCARCDTILPIECFDFHHTDPRMKDFSVSQEALCRYKWERVLEEASKCLMLCANCHRTVHALNEENYFEDAYSRHRDERTTPGVGDLPLFGGGLVGP